MSSLINERMRVTAITGLRKAFLGYMVAPQTFTPQGFRSVPQPPLTNERMRVAAIGAKVCKSRFRTTYKVGTKALVMYRFEGVPKIFADFANCRKWVKWGGLQENEIYISLQQLFATNKKPLSRAVVSKWTIEILWLLKCKRRLVAQLSLLAGGESLTRRFGNTCRVRSRLVGSWFLESSELAKMFSLLLLVCWYTPIVLISSTKSLGIPTEYQHSF